jgi:hypothetical protein
MVHGREPEAESPETVTQAFGVHAQAFGVHAQAFGVHAQAFGVHAQAFGVRASFWCACKLLVCMFAFG